MKKSIFLSYFLILIIAASSITSCSRKIESKRIETINSEAILNINGNSYPITFSFDDNDVLTVCYTQNESSSNGLKVTVQNDEIKYEYQNITKKLYGNFTPFSMIASAFKEYNSKKDLLPLIKNNSLIIYRFTENDNEYELTFREKSYDLEKVIIKSDSVKAEMNIKTYQEE